MKKYRYIIILFILLLTNSSKSQWMLDSYLPYDTTVGAGPPLLENLCTVDSSHSWVIGAYVKNNLVKNYIAKRTSTGWVEIKNHDLDTSIRSIILVTAKDTSNAWVSTSRGKVVHTTNGG